MARSLERAVRFTGPGGAILNMILFLGVVLVVAYYLSPLSPTPNELLVTSFLANPYLNGLIIGVLVIGIFYNIRQALVIDPAIRWVNSFRKSVDPSRTRLPRPPGLIGAMARILLDADEQGGRLSQASARAILDSIGTRIDEGREFSRYTMNLLVFLGLLGTFWGLLQTVTDVSGVISSLGASTGDDADAAGAVSQLINNLNEPLSGMNTAFSSSLFGLGGSLILGFLDIQAGQAQNRFYSDLEDWISGIVDTTTVQGNGIAATMDGGSLSDAMATLHAAIKELNASNDRAASGVRQEIRDLGRLLLEGQRPRDPR